MTLAAADRELLDKRSMLTEVEQRLIEVTLTDTVFRCKHAGLNPAVDDRQAALEAALMRYLLASRSAGPTYVSGWHTTRLSDNQEYAQETLYITRWDGTVAASDEHRYSDSFIGDWKWHERPDLTEEWVKTHCSYIGNYIDPSPR